MLFFKKKKTLKGLQEIALAGHKNYMVLMQNKEVEFVFTPNKKVASRFLAFKNY